MPWRVALTPEECDSLVASLPESLQSVDASLKYPGPRAVVEGDPLTPCGHKILDPICRAVQSIIAQRVNNALRTPETDRDHYAGELLRFHDAVIAVWKKSPNETRRLLEEALVAVDMPDAEEYCAGLWSAEHHEKCEA